MIEKLKLSPLLLFLISPLILLLFMPFNGLLGDFYYYIGLRVLCIIIVIVVFVHEFLHKKFKWNLSLVLFLLLVVWIITSECIEGFTNAAVFWDINNNGTLIDYLINILCFFAFTQTINNKKLLVNTQMIISAFLAIATLYTYYQYGIPKNWGLTSIYNNSNHYGYYLAVSCSLAGAYIIFEKLSYLAMISFGLNSLTLIYNDTFGAWIAVLFSLIFAIITYRVVFKRWSKNSVLVLLSFVVITVFGGLTGGGIVRTLNQFSNDVARIQNGKELDKIGSSRGILWRYTIEYIKQKPLFGWGIGGTDELLQSVAGNSRPHNEYLTYAVFFGIPAALLYLSGVMTVFFHNLKFKHELTSLEIICMITAFGYLVSACFGNIKSYTAPLLFIFLGMAYHKQAKPEIPSVQNV